MSQASQAFLQWVEMQLEPDYRITPQGGRPITRGGGLATDLQRMADEQAWAAQERENLEREREYLAKHGINF